MYFRIYLFPVTCVGGSSQPRETMICCTHTYARFDRGKKHSDDTMFKLGCSCSSAFVVAQAGCLVVVRKAKKGLDGRR